VLRDSPEMANRAPTWRARWKAPREFVVTGLFAKVPRPSFLRDSVRKGRIAMAVRRRRRSSLRLSIARIATPGVGWRLSGLAPGFHAASVECSASRFVSSPRVGPLVNRAISASAAIARLFEASRRNGVTFVAMAQSHCEVRVPRMSGDRRFKLASSFDCRDRRATLGRAPRPPETEADCGGFRFALLYRCVVSKGAVLLQWFRPLV
jgi:hypothetical protein